MIRLIVGPPGAGKTTYAQQHAAETDQIIDLDVLRTQYGSDELARTVRTLMENQAASYDRGDVWIIRTLADPHERRSFERRAGVDQTIALDPGDETCLQRIQVRDGNTDKAEGITRWRTHNPTPTEGPTMTTHTTSTNQAPQDGASGQDRQEQPADTPQRSQAAQNAPEAPQADPEAAEPADGQEDGAEGEKQPTGSKANREAAKYRTQAREAEARLAALQETIDTAQRREVEQLCAQEQLVHKPGALWKLGLSLDEIRDESGNIDAEKARAGVKTIQQEYGLIIKPAPPRLTHQGYTPSSGNGSGWAESFEPGD